jgi:hypothetical protein
MTIAASLREAVRATADKGIALQIRAPIASECTTHPRLGGASTAEPAMTHIVRIAPWSAPHLGRPRLRSPDSAKRHGNPARKTGYRNTHEFPVP